MVKKSLGHYCRQASLVDLTTEAISCIYTRHQTSTTLRCVIIFIIWSFWKLVSRCTMSKKLSIPLFRSIGLHQGVQCRKTLSMLIFRSIGLKLWHFSASLITKIKSYGSCCCVAGRTLQINYVYWGPLS